jgi:hypothetical protein
MSDIPAQPTYPHARHTIETYLVPDGSCFLYDPVSDASYTLDQLGALVWDYCDGATAVERIVQEITELLPTRDEAVARVSALLADFAQEGLLDNQTPQLSPTTESSSADD